MYSLPLIKGVNKLESPSPKNAGLQISFTVWFNLNSGSKEDENMKRKTVRGYMTDNRQSEKAYVNFQLLTDFY